MRCSGVERGAVSPVRRVDNPARHGVTAAAVGWKGQPLGLADGRNRNSRTKKKKRRRPEHCIALPWRCVALMVLQCQPVECDGVQRDDRWHFTHTRCAPDQQHTDTQTSDAVRCAQTAMRWPLAPALRCRAVTFECNAMQCNAMQCKQHRRRTGRQPDAQPHLGRDGEPSVASELSPARAVGPADSQRRQYDQLERQQS